MAYLRETDVWEGALQPAQSSPVGYFNPERGQVAKGKLAHTSPIVKNILKKSEATSSAALIHETPGQMLINGIPFAGSWHWGREGQLGAPPRSIAVSEENHLSYYNGLRNGDGVSIQSGQSRGIVNVSAIFTKEQLGRTLEPIVASLKRFPLCIIDNELLRRSLPVLPHEPIAAFVQAVNISTIAGFAGATQVDFQFIWFNHRPLTSRLVMREDWINDKVLKARAEYRKLGRDEFIEAYGHPADVFAATGSPGAGRGGDVLKAAPFLNYVYQRSALAASNKLPGPSEEGPADWNSYKHDPFALGTTRFIFPVFKDPFISFGADKNRDNLINYTKSLLDRKKEPTLQEKKILQTEMSNIWLGDELVLQDPFKSEKERKLLRDGGVGTLPDNLKDIVRRAAAEFSVPEYVLATLIAIESSNNPGATNVRKGGDGRYIFAERGEKHGPTTTASGLLQIVRKTWGDIGLKVEGGTELVRWLGPGGNADLRRMRGKSDSEVQSLTFSNGSSGAEWLAAKNSPWASGETQFNPIHNIRAAAKYLQRLKRSYCRRKKISNLTDWWPIAQRYHMGNGGGNAIDRYQTIGFVDEDGSPLSGKALKIAQNNLERSKKYHANWTRKLKLNRAGAKKQAQKAKTGGPKKVKVYAMASGFFDHKQEGKQGHYLSVWTKGQNGQNDAWLITYGPLEKVPSKLRAAQKAKGKIPIKSGEYIGTLALKTSPDLIAHKDSSGLQDAEIDAILKSQGKKPTPKNRAALRHIADGPEVQRPQIETGVGADKFRGSNSAFIEADLFKMARSGDQSRGDMSQELIETGRQAFQKHMGAEKEEGMANFDKLKMPTPADALRAILEYKGHSLPEDVAEEGLLQIAMDSMEVSNFSKKEEAVIKELKQIIEEGWIWMRHPFTYKYALFKVEGIAVPDFDWVTGDTPASGGVTLGVTTGISIGIGKALSITPLQGHRFPTIQYTGGERSTAKISMRLKGDAENLNSDGRGFLSTFRSLCNNYYDAAINFREFTRGMPISIESPFLSIFGVDDVMIESMHTETVPGSPEAIDLTLTVVSQGKMSSAHSGKLTPISGASHSLFINEILQVLLDEGYIDLGFGDDALKVSGHSSGLSYFLSPLAAELYQAARNPSKAGLAALIFSSSDVQTYTKSQAATAKVKRVQKNARKTGCGWGPNSPWTKGQIHFFLDWYKQVRSGQNLFLDEKETPYLRLGTWALRPKGARASGKLSRLMGTGSEIEKTIEEAVLATTRKAGGVQVSRTGGASGVVSPEFIALTSERLGFTSAFATASESANSQRYDFERLIEEANKRFESYVGEINTLSGRRETITQIAKELSSARYVTLNGEKLEIAHELFSRRSPDSESRSMLYGNFLLLYTNFFGAPLIKEFQPGTRISRLIARIGRLLSLELQGKPTSLAMKKLLEMHGESAFALSGEEMPAYRDLDLPPNPISGLTTDINPNCFFWDRSYLNAITPEATKMLFDTPPEEHPLIRKTRLKGGIGGEATARNVEKYKRFIYRDLDLGPRSETGELIYGEKGRSFQLGGANKELSTRERAKQLHAGTTLLGREDGTPFNVRNAINQIQNREPSKKEKATGQDFYETSKDGGQVTKSAQQRQADNTEAEPGTIKEMQAKTLSARTTQNQLNQAFDTGHWNELHKKALLSSKSLRRSINNSFPTFQVLFIEEDSESIFYSTMFDDFYGANSILSIQVINRKDMAASVCTIQMLDVDGFLFNRNFEPGENENLRYEDRTGPINYKGKQIKESRTADPLDNPFYSTMIKDGMKIMVRMGFSNDPLDLETVFVGQVASFSGSHIVTLVCQSYGTELVAQEFGTDPSDEVDFWNTYTEDIISNLLDRSELRHFGRWELSDVDPFGAWPWVGGVNKIRPDGKSKKVWTMTPSLVDDNIFFGINDESTDWFSAIIGGLEYVFWNTTVWDTLKEMELRNPGYIAYPLPYGDRMTLFFGLPDQLYLSRPAHTKSEKMNEIMGNPLNNYDTLDQLVRWAGNKQFSYVDSQGDKVYSSSSTKLEDKSDSEFVASFLHAVHRLKGNWEDVEKSGNISNWFNRSKGYAPNMAPEPWRETVKGQVFSAVVASKAKKMWEEIEKLAGRSLNEEDIERLIKDGVLTREGLYNAANMQQGARTEVFRNYILASSTRSIVQNNIKTDKTGTFNALTLKYSPRDVNWSTFNDQAEVLEIQADDSMKDHHLRREVQGWPNAANPHLANCYSAQLMANSLKRIYKGNLLLLGDPQVKPYDVIFIADTYADMAGPVEVEEVVHSLTRETGMTTDIVPNLMIAVADKTTQPFVDTMGQTMSEVVSDDIKNLMIGAGLGLAPGVVVPGIMKTVGWGATGIKTTINLGKTVGTDIGAAVAGTKTAQLAAEGGAKLAQTRIGAAVAESVKDGVVAGATAKVKKTVEAIEKMATKTEKLRGMDKAKAEALAVKKGGGPGTTVEGADELALRYVQLADEGIETAAASSAEAAAAVSVKETAATGISLGEKAGRTVLGAGVLAGGHAAVNDGDSPWRDLIFQGAGAGVALLFPVAAGISLAAAGIALYKLANHNQTRQPLIITPLIKGGKPYIIGLEGFEDDSLLTNTKKKWQWFGEDIAAGWAALNEGWESLLD